MSADPGAVQSVQRAFLILEAMAAAGEEIGVSRLAATTHLPLPTIHRAVKTLVTLGYVRQELNRRYSLGARLLYLGDAAGRGLGAWARPHLILLAELCGESVNLAVLEADRVVYISQAPSRHSMRMFTEIGRRVLPHATAVGKAMLAIMERKEVLALLERTGLPRYTDSTYTVTSNFCASLDIIAARGYALDEGEQEVGVRCVAVALPYEGFRAAISISGPSSRVTNEFVEQFLPALKTTAVELGQELHE
jgi:IclR family acetate operon transcriptional repressor